MGAPSLAQRADRGTRAIAIALGFSLPVSTALDNILLAAFLCLWALSNDFRERLALVARHPVAIGAVAFFALHLVSAAYTIATPLEWLESLRKGIAFLLLPMLIPVFSDPRTRTLAWHAFSAAMIVTLLLSYAIWAGWTPPPDLLKGTPSNPLVFKFTITQSVLMAFAAVLFAVRARHAVGIRARVAWAALAVLAVVNVLFMVHGRTGQLVILVLIVFLGIHWGRWRGTLVAAAIAAAALGAAWLMPSSALSDRIERSLWEYRSLDPARPQATSMSERLYWYRTSVALVADRPLLGAGAGGFATAFAEKVPHAPEMHTSNPHNEYLRVAVEFGVLGLAVMLFLLIVQWRLAARLPEPPDVALARAVVVTIAVASLVSSTWLDHTERLWYLWASALLFAAVHSAPREIRDGAGT